MREMLRSLGVPELLLPVAEVVCRQEEEKEVVGFVPETDSSGLLVLVYPKGGFRVEGVSLYYLSSQRAELVEEASLSLLSDLFTRLSLIFPLPGQEGGKHRKIVNRMQSEPYNKRKEIQGGQP